MLPFSWIYALGVRVRNRAFDRGQLPVLHAGVPTIAVGNLTAGGTGKTPLVEFLVEMLVQHGSRVGVLSRGYGRKTQGVVVVSDGLHVLTDAIHGGDEPVQIARKFPTACVVVAERRVEAARKAVGELGAEVLVLDDAFQHRYIARDLDIVIVDTDRDLAGEPMLPAGRRREPLSALRRADVLALARGTRADVDAWRARFGQGRSPKIVSFAHRLETICSAGKSGQDPHSHTFLAFCGIGRPERFLHDLREAGVTVVDSATFRDHHWFTMRDIDMLLSRMARCGATALVTTEKDMMRLESGTDVVDRILTRYPLFYTRIGVQITNGSDALYEAVQHCVRKAGEV